MAKLISEHKILLQNVRLAFPRLLSPDPQSNKYSASFIFPKGSEEEKLLLAEVEKTAREKFAVKADKVLAGLKRNGKFPIKDGDEKAEYNGFEGNSFIGARTSVRPTCVTPGRKEMNEDEVAEFMYSGAVVNAIVSLFTYTADKGGSDGVGIGLQGIQFVKEGDRLAGGGRAKADEFEQLEAADSNLDDCPF